MSIAVKVVVQFIFATFPLLVVAYRGPTTPTGIEFSMRAQLLLAVSPAWQWALSGLFIASSALILIGVITEVMPNSPERSSKANQMIWSGLFTLSLFSYPFYNFWGGSLFLSDELFLSVLRGHQILTASDLIFLASSFSAKIVVAMGWVVLICSTLRGSSRRRYFTALVSAVFLYVFVSFFILNLHEKAVNLLLDYHLLDLSQIFFTLSFASALLAICIIAAVIGKMISSGGLRASSMHDQLILLYPIMRKVLLLTTIAAAAFLTSITIIYHKEKSKYDVLRWDYPPS
jgi:hypothetical protein